MDIIIRLAKEEEISWINSRYAEVDFVPSNYQNEIIAIAQVGDEKAGIGRLVKISDDCFELGGMLVFEQYRGLGLSKYIIEFLLKRISGKSIYCIPFAHLFELYNNFGFSKCNDFSKVPTPIIEKFRWCESHYEQTVILLKLVI
jgi:predicted GNAT family N-acyltransferase